MEEFVEIDLSVTVLVDFGNSLVELLLRVDIAELLTRQQVQELTRVNLATVVHIKHLEGRLKVGLAQEGRRVHGRSQELSVVDVARVVGVSASQDLDELLAVLSVTEAVLELLQAD